MPPIIENDQTTSTVDVDLDGGWVVTHYTHTWDTRERLDQVQAKLEVAKAQLAEAQSTVDALTSVTTQIATQATNIVAEPPQPGLKVL